MEQPAPDISREIAAAVRLRLDRILWDTIHAPPADLRAILRAAGLEPVEPVMDGRFTLWACAPRLELPRDFRRALMGPPPARPGSAREALDRILLRPYEH